MLQLLLVPMLSVSLHALAVPNALLFEAVRDPAGRSILFVRDCGFGRLPQDVTSLGVEACESWQGGFTGRGTYESRDGRQLQYAGDAQVLAAHLGRQRFAEVWLYSGGGDLGEGVAIGRLLRQSRMTVRVPNVERVRGVMPWPQPDGNVRCISSCTVAFMGGLFRYMDDGASYEVHSASGVLGIVDTATTRRVMTGQLRPVMAKKCEGSRYWAAKLFRYFQNSLLQTTRYPQVTESEQEYDEYAQRGTAVMPYTAEQELRDLERLQSEGVIAVQDMIMRFERGCMAAAIDQLRQAPAARTPRAGPALRMLESMYTVSIKETQSMTRETMLRMGYLTQEIDAPGTS
ncbi:MAG: hypothetical protein IPF98_04380 [Gemmatimonadetes bacterium]|nr:hypothetical protein [Gemmatimonadota bacterium]